MANKLGEFRMIMIDGLEKDDILTNGSVSIKVLQKPYKKWVKTLLWVITLGIYKAPDGYKVMVIEE